MRASSSGSGTEVRLIALLRGLSNWFSFGIGEVVEGPALMWKVIRSLGLSLGFVDGTWRASELDRWLGSSERISDGSQRGVACENTLLSLAFILLSFTQVGEWERQCACEMLDQLIVDQIEASGSSIELQVLGVEMRSICGLGRKQRVIQGLALIPCECLALNSVRGSWGAAVERDGGVGRGKLSRVPALACEVSHRRRDEA